MQLIKIILVVFISLVSFKATSEMIVIDEQNELHRLGNRLHSPAWENSVVCKSKATFLANTKSCHYKCVGLGCVTTCEEPAIDEKKFELQIDDCNPEEVAIYGNGLSVAVNKLEYDLTGTWIHGLLRNLDRFITPSGYIYVGMAHMRMFNIFENGQMKTEFGESLQVIYKSTPDSGEIPIDIGFLRGRNLLNSIVIIRQGFGSDTNDFLKLKGVSYAH